MHIYIAFFDEDTLQVLNCVLFKFQAFASPGWEKGMNRQSVKAVLDMFNKAGVKRFSSFNSN